MAKDELERSGSGAPIYRHKAKDRPDGFQPPDESCVHLKDIEAHLEKYIGPIESVFHEIVSDLVHLDVLWIAATGKRPFHVLVTSGVSDKPMNAPREMANFRHAELMMVLPADWPLTEDAFKNEANYWPVRWLKMIGRMPHEYNTWISWGHTIPNGDPPKRIANTNFTGVVLTAPFWLPPDFFELKTASGDTIHFFMLFPLHQAEMDLKLREGMEALEERFEKAQVDFILDVRRPSVAAPPKRRWFGR